jgi:hypothetical protein
MNFKQVFLIYFIFIFLFLNLYFVIAGFTPSNLKPLENIQDFGKIVLEEINNLTKEQIATLQIQGIKIFQDENYLEIGIIRKNASCFLDSFSDLDISKSIIIPLIKINKSNQEAIEANLLIKEDSYFRFGKNLLYAPKDSRIIFENNEIRLYLSEGTPLNYLPNLINSGTTNNKIIIQGNNIKFPGELELIEGQISIQDNGYLLESNSIANYKQVFLGKQEYPVLISNKLLENYDENWIYQDNNWLIMQGSKDKSLSAEILENHAIFNTDKKDNLFIFLEGGDKLSVQSRKEQELIPFIFHESNYDGSSRIHNDRMTFYFEKEGNDIYLRPAKSKEDFESKYQSVAMEIGSNIPSLKNEKIRINSYNQMSILSKNNEEFVTFNKYDLPISSLIKDNELQTIAQLREKYPNMNFQILKNYEGIKNDFNEENMPPYMVYLTDNWLQKNPEALKDINKIEFGNFRNAYAKDSDLGIGNLIVDYDISGGVRKIQPLQILDHEYEHIKDNLISDKEMEILRLSKDPKIIKLFQQREEIERLNEKYPPFSKQLLDLKIIDKQIKSIYYSKNERKPLLNQIYNKISLDAQTELFQGEISEGLFKQLSDQTDKKIFEQLKRISNEEGFNIGDFGSSQNLFMLSFNLIEHYENRLGESELNDNENSIMIKLYDLKNLALQSNMFKDISFYSQKDLMTSLGNFNSYGDDDLNNKLDDLIKTRTGLPNYYSLRNYNYEDDAALGGYREISSTFTELSESEIIKQLNFPPKNIQERMRSLVQVEFDSGKMNVEEYKKLMGKDYCKRKDCCDKKCLIYTFTCVGKC